MPLEDPKMYENYPKNRNLKNNEENDKIELDTFYLFSKKKKHFE